VYRTDFNSVCIGLPVGLRFVPSRFNVVSDIGLFITSFTAGFWISDLFLSALRQPSPVGTSSPYTVGWTYGECVSPEWNGLSNDIRWVRIRMTSWREENEPSQKYGRLTGMRLNSETKPRLTSQLTAQKCINQIISRYHCFTVSITPPPSFPLSSAEGHWTDTWSFFQHCCDIRWSLAILLSRSRFRHVHCHFTIKSYRCFAASITH